MYDEAAMASDRTGFGEVDSDVISLGAAVDNAQMQAEKLAQMVAELMKRLEPLRREPGPEVPTDGIALKRAPNYGSPMAARVDGVVATIRTTQSRLAIVMSDLDLS